jgi:hypothetical protein
MARDVYISGTKQTHHSLRQYAVLLTIIFTLQSNSFLSRAMLVSPVSEEWKADMYSSQMWRQVLEYDWYTSTVSPVTRRASNLMRPDTPLLLYRLQYSVDQNKTMISLAVNQTNLNIHGTLPLQSRFLWRVTSHHELFGWEEMTSRRHLWFMSTQMKK